MPTENDGAPAPVAQPTSAQPTTTAAPAAAPAPQAAPSAPAAATPAAPAAGGETVIPPLAQPQADPEWLGKRLGQAKKNAEDGARKALLAELGVDNIDAAKARIAAAKAAEEATKTEIQKATERAAALEAEAGRAKVLSQIVNERASSEMSSLSDAQQQTVKDLAGDDPAAQLRTIDRLRKGGLLGITTVSAPAAPAAPIAPAPAAPAAPAPLAAPASTAPTAPAPAPAAPNTAEDDIKKTYERLRSSPHKGDQLAARMMGAQYATVLFPNLTK